MGAPQRRSQRRFAPPQADSAGCKRPRECAREVVGAPLRRHKPVSRDGTPQARLSTLRPLPMPRPVHLDIPRRPRPAGASAGARAPSSHARSLHRAGRRAAAGQHGALQLVSAPSGRAAAATVRDLHQCAGGSGAERTRVRRWRRLPQPPARVRGERKPRNAGSWGGQLEQRSWRSLGVRRLKTRRMCAAHLPRSAQWRLIAARTARTMIFQCTAPHQPPLIAPGCPWRARRERPAEG